MAKSALISIVTTALAYRDTVRKAELAETLEDSDGSSPVPSSELYKQAQELYENLLALLDSYSPPPEIKFD